MLAARHQETVVDERFNGLALVGADRPQSVAIERLVESSVATSEDTMSCASVSVFIRNTSPRAGSGTRRLNIEDCMISSFCCNERATDRCTMR